MQEEKTEFIANYLTKHMNKVIVKNELHGQYLKRLADMEELAESIYLKSLNKKKQVN